MEELEAIGLARDGKILLEESDLEALLAGRRTQMLRLENLAAEGIHIAALDAKLSLKSDASGNLELLIHPIYRKPQHKGYLTDGEATLLEKGEMANIVKELSDTNGNRSEVLIEFDRDTNEYIITDTDQILVPERVNGEALTPDQKERYRKGKEVELDDGASFCYAATEREGLRSNKIALVASILIDGGLSFMLYQGLNALFGQKHNAQSAQMSEGYRKAFADLKKSEDEFESLELKGPHPDAAYSRGYGRSGASR